MVIILHLGRYKVDSATSAFQFPNTLLIIKFTPGLFSTLKLAFPKTRFNLTGVFIHQNPIVNIGKGKNPELGDILFVYIHTDIHGNKRHNSLMMQAKVAKGKSTNIRSTDKHQLELYSYWPKFHYAKTGRSSPKIYRDIVPKSINDGAQYLVIRDSKTLFGELCDPNTFSCAVPAKSLEVDNTLVDELIDLLKFKSGRTFDERTIVSDDWSKMIWDLLDRTLGKASRRKNINVTDFQRQSANEYDGYTYIGRYGGLFSNITESDRIDPNTVDDNEGGLSLVLIEASEQVG